MAKLTRRTFGFLATSAFAGTVAGSGTARAAAGRARDVVVFCDPTLRPMMTELGRLWRARGGAPIHVFCARSDIFVEQIWRGARCDLAIIEGAALADAAAGRALIKAETRYAGWRNRMIVAGAKAQGEPAPLAANADLAALLGNGRLAIADPPIAPAGAAARTALERLGLWASVSGRVIGVENTETVASLVASGRAPLGIIQRTDLAATPGLSAVATIPDDASPPIGYVMAQTMSTATPETPHLAEFLRGAGARRSIEAAGLEVMS